MIFNEQHKSQPISKLQVNEAFKRVKANKGSSGVDGISIEQVAQNPRKYLYPLWNRMSSGSYFPKPVRQVLIPKGDGKMRPLGIPTIVDRVAQQVIATELEANGTQIQPQGKGTPQGGVISPVLANIFLDIVFDKWITKESPTTPFERYADDIVIHCVNIKEALRLLEKVRQRFKDCKLELNQEKSKIVYCRNNQKRQPPFKVRYQKFDFLGYTFKPRAVKERGKIKLGFSPAISQKSRTRIANELKTMDFHRWVHFPISRIAELLKLKIRGWINYYGKFRMSEMRKVFRLLHKRLVKWIRNKYRRYRKQRWGNAYKYLQSLSRSYPNLFEHWQYEGFRP